MFDVLIVDDDHASLMLTTEALSRIDVEVASHTVANGNQALSFLQREAGYEQSPRPDLMLLDWNIPGIHGRDVLARMRRNEMINDIPVAIVSASEAKRDVDEAREFGVKDYLFKDADMFEFMDSLKALISRIRETY